MADDGVVIVLDFVGDREPAKGRDVLTHSFRSTTSSRRPGASIQGTVAAFTRRVVICEFCKRKRLDFDAPHSPVSAGSNNEVRDCAGRIWRDGRLVS